MTPEQFFAQFRFDPARRGHIGIELEGFLYRGDRPVPEAQRFLADFGDGEWGEELSACQIEWHPPAPFASIETLERETRAAIVVARANARTIGCGLRFSEIAPEDMPLDVFPNDRYPALVASLPTDRLRAACRVAALQFHFGVGSIEEAIAVHNLAVRHLDELCAAGDHSDGERLSLYKTNAISWQPPLYESPEHVLRTARNEGWESSLRNCWHMIRISRHGSVEFRMFGSTDDVAKIIALARRVCLIGGRALRPGFGHFR